jgi:hypothetical protein
MAGDPWRMDDTVQVVVSQETAAALLAEVAKTPSRRTVLPMTVGEHDAGSWQVDAVSTRRSDAGYDDFMVTLRRVLV